MAFVQFTTEVQITHDELHDAGWHHQSQCGNPTKGGPVSDYNERARRNAIDLAAELHREAHPQGTLMITNCHERLCRDLVATIGVWDRAHV